MKNIYAEGELDDGSTTEKFSVVRKDGARNVRRTLDFYNLDAIIAVGYRVNSKQAALRSNRADCCGDSLFSSGCGETNDGAYDMERCSKWENPKE